MGVAAAAAGPAAAAPPRPPEVVVIPRLGAFGEGERENLEREGCEAVVIPSPAEPAAIAIARAAPGPAKGS